MSDGPAPEICDGELLAAVDLGSNSFHLVVARYEHGELRVIDRLRDSVRLAAGLRPDGSLDDARREEARLIYLGVAHGVPDSPQRRLVIDIGGGSTEFIIGQHFEALEKESLQMGCVASTLRFFGDGKLSPKRWRQAQTEIAVELQQ